MTKIVLITGVSRGIGNATAKLFSKKGWHVIGVSREDTDDLIEGVDHYIQGDISQLGDVEGIFKNISAHYERIDCLVNNAALQICKPILEMTIDEWDSVMKTNLRSVFLFSKYSHPFLQKVHGSIVNVSSVHAIATSSDIAAYAASKGGIASFTRALAIEFAQENIRVNAVLPGAVDTPMLRAGLSRGHVTGSSMDERLKALAGKHLFKRVARPDEIANMIYFLADESLSSAITGQCFVVDGGAIIRLSTE